MPFTLSEISREPFALASASLRISPATTAKPLPISPAWAASIPAFIASTFVSAAILSISVTISFMRSVCSSMDAI